MDKIKSRSIRKYTFLLIFPVFAVAFFFLWSQASPSKYDIEGFHVGMPISAIERLDGSISKSNNTQRVIVTLENFGEYSVIELEFDSEKLVRAFGIIDPIQVTVSDSTNEFIKKLGAPNDEYDFPIMLLWGNGVLEHGRYFPKVKSTGEYFTVWYLPSKKEENKFRLWAFLIGEGEDRGIPSLE